MNKQFHDHSPVFLTPAGADALKVEPLIEALMKIGDLAATSSVAEFAWNLGRIAGTVMSTLEAVGEKEKADQVRATFDAHNPPVH